MSGGDDSTVRSWDLTTGQEIGEAVIYHKGGVLGLASCSRLETNIVSDRTGEIWCHANGSGVRGRSEEDPEEEGEEGEGEGEGAASSGTEEVS